MTAFAFADPVFESQATFRSVLHAMASPGQIVDAGEALAPPAPLGRAAAAALLTLADFETPLWIAPSFAGSGVEPISNSTPARRSPPRPKTPRSRWRTPRPTRSSSYASRKGRRNIPTARPH
jgi:alpha-D-ribose 1-methylphosphonate 5-triphosphate synthase subunit PhnH